MTLETIKTNIDRKIERMIKQESKTLPDIAKQLVNTKDSFKDLLNADTNTTTRTHMMKMYIDFSDKRIVDLEFIEDRLVPNEYFAGCSDEHLFKLMQFRDKVSKDAIDANLN